MVECDVIAARKTINNRVGGKNGNSL